MFGPGTLELVSLFLLLCFLMLPDLACCLECQDVLSRRRQYARAARANHPELLGTSRIPYLPDESCVGPEKKLELTNWLGLAAAQFGSDRLDA